MLMTKLTNSMEVIGKNILVSPLSLKISPGNLPNQLNIHGANFIIIPAKINKIPINTNQRDMFKIILIYRGQ